MIIYDRLKSGSVIGGTRRKEKEARPSTRSGVFEGVGGSYSILYVHFLVENLKSTFILFWVPSGQIQVLVVSR